jgi:hypothetical protein
MFLIKFINDPSKFIRIFNGYEESNRTDALKFDTYDDAFYEIAKIHWDETNEWQFDVFEVFDSTVD